MRTIVTEDYFRRLYVIEHKTLEVIAAELGITRQAAYYYKKKFNVLTEDGEWAKFNCDQCGKPAKIQRCRYNQSIRHFCSSACYSEHMKSPGYKNNRQGQRIGRAVVEQTRGYALREGEVVHHIDGNNLNNDPSNLMVFKSQSEHTTHHYHLRLKKLSLI